MFGRLDAQTLRRSLINDGITDETVLDAIGAIPRELFVPPAFRERAYDDLAADRGRHDDGGAGTR